MLAAVPASAVQSSLLPATWLSAPSCSRCGRSAVLQGFLVLSDLGTPPHLAPGVCWWAAPDAPLTAELASRSGICVGAHHLPGILPVRHLRAFHCAPVIPLSGPAAVFEELLLSYGGSLLTGRLADPVLAEPLRVLSINCGGLTTKLPRLLALLHWTDPDVVCLQETSGCLAEPLPGMAYRVWANTPVRGGGLAILLHPRRLPAGLHAVAVDLGPHHLGVSMPVREGFVLSVVNLHLAPSLSGVSRREICVHVASWLAGRPSGAKLLVGDLNEWPRHRGGWLRPALQPRGIWAGWRCPYPPGQATNLVHTVRGSSSRELDWVLVSADHTSFNSCPPPPRAGGCLTRRRPRTAGLH